MSDIRLPTSASLDALVNGTFKMSVADTDGSVKTHTLANSIDKPVGAVVSMKKTNRNATVTADVDEVDAQTKGKNGATVVVTHDPVHEARRAAVPDDAAATAGDDDIACDADDEGSVHCHTIKKIPTVPFAEGTGYSVSTPVHDFADWVDYNLFCEDGPKIKILCAKDIVDGETVSMASIKVSQKLLGDHSSYFCALLHGPWKEAKTCVLRVPDIKIEHFKRLHLILQSGGACPRIRLGRATALVANLTETFILADYFDMPGPKQWLRDCLTEYLNEHRSWHNTYVNQILDEYDGDAAEIVHKIKIHDICRAFMRLQTVTEDQSIIQPDELIRFVINHCPRPLMGCVISDLDPEFKDAVFSAYLLM